MNQKARRDYLVRSLIKEQPRYRGMEIEASEQEAKRQLRSLMNVRMAAPIREGVRFPRDDRGGRVGLFGVTRGMS